MRIMDPTNMPHESISLLETHVSKSLTTDPGHDKLLQGIRDGVKLKCVRRTVKVDESLVNGTLSQALKTALNERLHRMRGRQEDEEPDSSDEDGVHDEWVND
jgi:hypothetical protein